MATSPLIIDHNSIEFNGIKVFEKIIFKNGGRIEKTLDNEACFMFLLRGTFEVRTPIKKICIPENKGFLTKCGEYFLEDIHLHDETAEIIETVAVYFHPTVIRDLFEVKPVRSDKNVAGIIDITKPLAQYLDALIYYLNNPDLFTVDLQLLKIKELILLLFKGSGLETFDQYISSLFSPNLYDFQQVVQNNCISSLSVEELAGLCHMSLSTFKRRFRRVYGSSPSQYIKEKKLAKAAKLLKSTDQRVNEIAFECGFESATSFNRIFKQQYGQSPSAYRMS